MSLKHLVALACAGAIFTASAAGIAPLRQYASTVDVIDTLGNLHTVWKGIDLGAARPPFEFAASWEISSFLVSGLKVHVNTSATTAWEEIGAIRLSGDTVAPPPPPARVPEPASLALMGLGLGLFGVVRRRRA